jgi:hypothetical protein
VTARERPPLLLYLARGDDPQRVAVGPALAAAAERGGWGFECYAAELRRGRHFGGGDPAAARTGQAAGSLVAGGRHPERAARLATGFAVAALGDPASPLWPALEAADVEVLARSEEPAALYAAALARLALTVPERAVVLDAAPQGPHGVITAPFLYPALLSGPPALALEASAGPEDRSALERMGVRRFEALGVAADRAARFPGGIDGDERLDVGDGWAPFTAAVARRYASWGRGVLLADPDVVAAQLPKARRLRLLALHGRPQVEAVALARSIVERAVEPVFGRQWDDRDFFALAGAGHGLQVLDPSPPFDASASVPARLPEPALDPATTMPDDAQLERWADEGRILTTLLLWSGMVRELDCVPRLLDLVAETGLRAGLIVTAETVEQGADEALGLLSVAPERGGVLGLLEPLLGSTGRGVAAEAYLPRGTLAAHLREAQDAIAARMPPALRPRGWWPLLDGRLVGRRELPIGRRGKRPVARVGPPGGDSAGDARTGPAARGARALASRAVHAARLRAFLEPRRPYDGRRPGALDGGVLAAVQGAGFEYMWSKTEFGTPRIAWRSGDFVVLPFTAGTWDGWSPFYTVGDAGAIRRAERRLRRSGRPGWLASTVDGPLFALPGEVWEHGARLHEIASTVAAGGDSGELVNVTPGVIARYARVLARRASLQPDTSA